MKLNPNRIAIGAIYALTIIYLPLKFTELKIPDYGYNWLPQFGAEFHDRKTESLRSANHLITSQWGYDGQFYAQLAVDPYFNDPDSLYAVDNFTFRARRILVPAIANALALGDPQQALNIYSALNIFTWLTIAILLLYWLPPVSWQNAIRYVSILYTSGLVTSITFALLDGPALMVVIIGVLLAERKQNLLSCVVLGMAGLAKDTSVFASYLFGIPKPFTLHNMISLSWKLMIVATPLLGWILYIKYGINAPKEMSLTLGLRNFDWPLFGWLKALRIQISQIETHGFRIFEVMSLCFLLSFPVQIFSIFALWLKDNLWWKVGFIYSAFSLLLGLSVWEGGVGATARTVLPLTVAFNLTIPKSARWLPILILGNLLAFVGYQQLSLIVPPKPTLIVTPDYASQIDFAKDAYPSLSWDDGWYGEEAHKDSRWRWSEDQSSFTIVSTSRSDSVATLSFQIRAINPSTVSISSNGDLVKTITAKEEFSDAISISIPVRYGSNTVNFVSDVPSAPTISDSRSLGFMLMNPKIKLTTNTISSQEWADGWHQKESDGANSWHWSHGPSIIRFNNLSNYTEATLTFRARSVSSGDTALTINGLDHSSFMTTDQLTDYLSIAIPIKSGQNELRFEPQFPPAFAPGDGRPLSLLIMNLDIKANTSPPKN